MASQAETWDSRGFRLHPANEDGFGEGVPAYPKGTCKPLGLSTLTKDFAACAAQL